MTSFLRGALVAALLVPVGVVAGDVAPAGAAAPTVSVTNGPPGTLVAVSSTDCTEPEEGDGFAYFEARLISGTGADEVLAGAASSDLGDPATMVVPDWIDPADPAVIETACVTFTFDFETDDETLERVVLDPVPFDVEPGVGSPVQSRSFSRTSLLTGQGLRMSGSGCTLAQPGGAGVDLAAGTDRTGRTIDDLVSYGSGEVDGTGFVAELVLTDAGTGISVSQTNDDPPVIEEVEEFPTDISPGSYTALPYCYDEEAEVTLLFEPQLIEVTGSAPIGDLDLTAAAGTSDVTFAGRGCTDGEVQGLLDSISAEELFDDFARIDHADAVGPFGVRRSAARPGALVGPSTGELLSGRSRSGRALAEDAYLEFTAAPSADGSWSVSDTAGFADGIVEGYSLCGDPFADGFLYDPQIVIVAAEPVTPPTTPPTTPPPTSPPTPPAPATAVRARPTYAG